MTFLRHLPLAAALVPLPTLAQSFQDIEAIEARAVAQTGADVSQVDRRIRLARCPEPLAADAPVSGGIVVRCNALGWRVRVLLARAAAARPIIRRGDPVSLSFATPRFTVTASGIAENDASAGDPVRVRVEQKGISVTGQAIEPGSVRIGTLK